jgi:hypothetical protein
MIIYCAIWQREYDLSDLQLRLADHGLSSLEMLESHVLVSIERILKHFNISPANTSSSFCKINSQDANSILAKRSELLFGRSNNGRRTHIMITLDSSDIFRYELIEQLLENGLEIVRINCAHNTNMEWKLHSNSSASLPNILKWSLISNGVFCSISLVHTTHENIRIYLLYFTFVNFIEIDYLQCQENSRWKGGSAIDFPENDVLLRACYALTIAGAFICVAYEHRI